MEISVMIDENLPNILFWAVIAFGVGFMVGFYHGSPTPEFGEEQETDGDNICGME
jgi:hypothetical protein